MISFRSLAYERCVAGTSKLTLSQLYESNFDFFRFKLKVFQAEVQNCITSPGNFQSTNSVWKSNFRFQSFSFFLSTWKSHAKVKCHLAGLVASSRAHFIILQWYTNKLSQKLSFTSRNLSRPSHITRFNSCLILKQISRYEANCNVLGLSVVQEARSLIFLLYLTTR